MGGVTSASEGSGRRSVGCVVAAEAVAVAMAVAKTSCSARLLLDDHFTELLLHTRHRQPEQVCQALHRHARVACCDDLDVVLCDARVERLEHERALRHGELGVPEGGKLGGESVLELSDVKNLLRDEALEQRAVPARGDRF